MVQKILKHIHQLQSTSDSKYFRKGIFPCVRYHPYFPYKRWDENVFFSSAIAFSLQSFLDEFTPEEKEVALKISDGVLQNYPSYKNYQGGITYNFFKTNPMDFFPNGWVMHRFRFFKLADDADDTAYVYLTDKHLNKEKNQLKLKLAQHANGVQKWNYHTLPLYRDLQAYGVYFGQKMPIELDLCVMTNVLLWSIQSDTEWNKYDEHTLQFVIRVLKSKDYIKNPHLVSPCYPSTAQIVYHISRLFKYSSRPFLKVYQKEFRQSVFKLFNQAKSGSFEQVLFAISFGYLGEIVPKLNYDQSKLLRKTSFFYTSVALMIPKLWLRKLYRYPVFRFLGLRTKCEAYVLSFLLEYELLQNKTSKVSRVD